MFAVPDGEFAVPAAVGRRRTVPGVDVPGVRVGHTTVVDPPGIHTGVTASSLAAATTTTGHQGRTLEAINPAEPRR